MQFLYKLLLGSLLVGFCLLAQAKTTLRFVTSADYPPFSHIDSNGEIVGFDIDIAKALCHELRITCTFTHRPWPTLIPLVQQGQFDAIIAAMAPTLERKQFLKFTQPYYQTNADLIMHKHHEIESSSALHGKIIGVQAGSIYELYLHHKYRGHVRIELYHNMDKAFVDLSKQRLDGVIASAPVINLWLKKETTRDDYQIIEESAAEIPNLGLGMAIAVHRDRKQLQEAFNDALERIKSHGWHKRIVRRYFDH